MAGLRSQRVAASELPKVAPLVDAQVSTRDGSSPSPAPKPDMAALREICAGDPCTLGIQDAMDDWPEPCTHIEYVEAEGEWYRCSLISGHKGKCQRGERV
jgi:hypothetical protein